MINSIHSSKAIDAALPDNLKDAPKTWWEAYSVTDDYERVVARINQAMTDLADDTARYRDKAAQGGDVTSDVGFLESKVRRMVEDAATKRAMEPFVARAQARAIEDGLDLGH